MMDVSIDVRLELDEVLALLPFAESAVRDGLLTSDEAERLLLEQVRMEFV
jgi:hypothetical protein